ncbi:MAG: DUF4376 domain-containing protein [Alphaproteobacteria bacterium]|nr:DUF4376 domain-containing protein [Alphaproteobacteria bacterium]
MTITAHYLDADHTLASRSDMPGATIPVSDDNRHWRELVDMGVTPTDYAPPAATTADVDRLRDAKIAAGFTFGGIVFQTDPDSVKRIAGAASAAHVAITQDGAQVGDLRWADPASDFGWIAQDNSVVVMDAPTVIAFGQAYMAHERALVFAAKAIKDRIRAGETVDIESAPEWP